MMIFDRKKNGKKKNNEYYRDENEIIFFEFHEVHNFLPIIKKDSE